MYTKIQGLRINVRLSNYGGFDSASYLIVSYHTRR